MGYQIVYDRRNRNRYLVRKKNRIVLPLAIAFLILMCILAFGKPIQEAFLPGNPQVTGAAMTSLVESIKSGESVYKALQVFCEDVIQGAILYG